MPYEDAINELSICHNVKDEAIDGPGMCHNVKDEGFYDLIHFWISFYPDSQRFYVSELEKASPDEGKLRERSKQGAYSSQISSRTVREALDVFWVLYNEHEGCKCSEIGTTTKLFYITYYPKWEGIHVCTLGNDPNVESAVREEVRICKGSKQSYRDLIEAQTVREALDTFWELYEKYKTSLCETRQETQESDE